MRRLVRILADPRGTMREILDNRVGGAVAIVVLAFVSSSLKQFDPRAVTTGKIAAVSALGFAFGIAFAIAMYYALSWLAMMTGRFFDGTGDYRSVRDAIGWGFVPFVWAILYRVPVLAFWPDALVKKHVERGGPDFAITNVWDAPLWQVGIVLTLETIVFVGYFFVASNTLAEAHRMTSLSAFGALLAAYVLPVIAVLAVGGAAYLAFR